MNYWWCAALFRIFLPCIIAAAGFLRPTISSYIYLVLGCYMPFFSVPTTRTIAGDTGYYMKLLMGTCILSCIMIFCSFFALYFTSNEEEYHLEYCSYLEVLIRTIGVVDYTGLSFLDGIVWILPEPLMLVTSVGLYIIFKKFTKPDTAIEVTEEEARMMLNRKKMVYIMLSISKYLVSLLLCFTSILKATAFGAVYYVVFLGVLTYWAFFRSLGKSYARVLVCLIPIMFLNMTVMFFYQFQYFQDSKVFTTTSIYGRLLNLVDLKTYKNCLDPRLFKFHAQSKINYAIPICLFFLYQLTILVSRQILEAEDGIMNLLVVFSRCELRRSPRTRWKAAINYVQRKVEKDKLSVLTENLEADWIKIILDQIFQFIIGISHIVANFLMMVWAIACIGWPGLILLVLSNIIWLVPARKKVMLWMSPLLVVLMIFLLSRTYLYSMDLTRDELPSKFGVVDFASGMRKSDKHQWVELLLKSLCGILIFVAMRRLTQERAMKRRERELKRISQLIFSRTQITDDEDSKYSFLETFQKVSLHFFAVWWMWIVIISMIWMDFWATSNPLRIAFVGLAMVFLATFQLFPFKFWKIFIWFYWWIVLIYATFNLIVIYMYQLPETRQFLFRYVPEARFKEYGFKIWKDMAQGSFALANPLFIQIAIVIQKTYLQKEFNKLTSPSTAEELAKEEEDLQHKGPKMRKFITTFKKAKNVFFEVLEIHLMKVILLIGWFMCVHDLCAICAMFVLLFTAGAVAGKRTLRFIIYFISHIVKVLIILRLLYMNQYTQHHKWDFVGYYTKAGKRYNVTLNAADWLGFHESSFGRSYADFDQLSWSFLFVLLVTLHRTVILRMKYYRLSRNLKAEKDPVLFPAITCENCYDSTENLLMYFANYGFYRFGCEICLICMTIVMAKRLDAFAVLWSILLLIMFSLGRVAMRRLWLPVLIFLALLVPVQYVSTLGLWPSLFYDTKADFWSSSDRLTMVQQFCQIMNMAIPPRKGKITWDFILFVLMSRQWLGFRHEWETRGQIIAAGNNDDVSKLIDDPKVKNPIPDFITYTRNFLDSYKRVFFRLWFYVTIVTIYVAGIMSGTVYSFFYIVGAIMISWEGTELFLRPPKTILRRWNLVIVYNVLIMMLKCTTQIFGCFVQYERLMDINCELIRFFAIGCKDKYTMSKVAPKVTQGPTCEVDDEALGLEWDCVCFFFLIWQQRIFKSYHFFHVVNSEKAQTILADRGAMLTKKFMTEKRQKYDNEKNIIENNMKKKLEKIKANYPKIEAIRSGDYKLFDQVEKEIDIPLLPPADDDDEDSEYDPFDPMPVQEYLGLLMITDVQTVVEVNEIRRRRKNAQIQEQLGKTGKKKPSKTAAASKEAATDEDSSATKKALQVLSFLWGIFQGCIVSLTMFINRRTKDFRKIVNQIHDDKRVLIEKTDYVNGVRLGDNKVWQPTRSYSDVLGEARQIRKGKGMQYTIYIKLLRALWYLFLTYSEWFCYLFVIDNQAIENSFITLPITLMTFCWGALTVPKPTRTFWVVCIAYTLIMLIVQHFFNMDLMPWKCNQLEERVWFPPGILGLCSRSRKTNFIILIPLFVHRIVLQSLGSWKTINIRTSSIIKDGEYKLSDNKFVPSKSSTDKGSPTLVATSINISMGDYFPDSILRGMAKYGENFRLYMQQLITPSITQTPVDVYLPMFLCDLINLFLLMFFFGEFQRDSEETGLVQFLKSNRVPINFLIIIIGYTLLMMIDRGLYLKRNRFGKLIYHFLQVIGFHIWFFVIHPMLTRRMVRSSYPVWFFYIFKCAYFLFSAYQIRSGYPNLIWGNALWHKYTIFNRIGYKLYRKIPYFLEMRCLQDWIFCDSCLGLPAWFKMEDVTQHLFIQKCQQKHEVEWGSHAGRAQTRALKYVQGGIIFFILIVALIFPFLLFSMSSTMGVATHPKKIKLEIYMGSAEPIFESYVPSNGITRLTQEEYWNFSETFNNIRYAEDILQSFDNEDVIAVQWSGNSLTSWDISPGTKEIILNELHLSENFLVRMQIDYTHIGHGGQKTERTFGQSATIPPLPDIQRQNLINMLKSDNDTNIVVTLPLIFPKFLKIKKESHPEALSLMEGREGPKNRELYASEEDDDNDLPPEPERLRNLLVTLRKTNEFWWQIKEDCAQEDDNYYYYLKDLPYNTCDGIVLYIFNERVFSSFLQVVINKGILGLYLIYFMVVIQNINGAITKINEIWIVSLPNPDKVLRKCIEMNVARDMQNYELEREIFEDIICIMRSRELLIKLTRFQDNNYDTMLVIPGSK